MHNCHENWEDINTQTAIQQVWATIEVSSASSSSKCLLLMWSFNSMYKGVPKSFQTESIMKYILKTINPH